MFYVLKEKEKLFSFMKKSLDQTMTSLNFPEMSGITSIFRKCALKHVVLEISPL